MTQQQQHHQQQQKQQQQQKTVDMQTLSYKKIHFTSNAITQNATKTI